jgi:hypothetical protein
MTLVDGNTGFYEYGSEYHKSSYMSLFGGFLQGVFKIEGFDYQILPTAIDNSVHFEFVLRPHDYAVSGNTLNNRYPQNKGIFFYIGQRAENKFAVLENTLVPVGDTDDIESGYTIDYLSSGSTSGETIYIKPMDSDGDEIFGPKYHEFNTDNKYLLFNRGKNGYTVDTWDENAEYTFKVEKSVIKDNMYLIMNRTKSGYTVDTLDRYEESLTSGSTNPYYSDYNVISDLKNNAFALKLNDDNSIGYRYLVKDCDNEYGWSVKEERSFPNIIQDDEWNVINVKFKILGNGTDVCGNSRGERKMKIYIYVNGYLKLVSQELPEFNFKPLDDKYTKQEMVPYTISLGGGTQGLAEMVWFDNFDGAKKVYPLEQNFAGSFIGDIRSFKAYVEPLQYNEIKSNYLYEKKILVRE